MARKKRSKISRFFYGVCLLFLTVGVLIMGFAVYWISALKIPDFSSFESRKIIQSTKIYDRTGKILLWDIHKNIRRTVVPFDEISRNLKNATVAIEDSNFYNHHGIDPLAIARSFITNITTGSTRGGSTISQQLIKNTLLTTEKKYARKIKEALLAFKLEQALPKEEILNIYLNEIPYGGSNYGIETASQSFLGKSAEELTLAESAYLAALPKAPTYYSPYGNNRDELENRKNLVLKRMLKLGFITEDEEKSAKKETVEFISKGDQSIKAPHFSIFIRSYLEKKYGKDTVERGGLNVITTLDYNLQQKAEELVAKYAEGNVKKFNANNAALVAIDPKTGQILTMVGSKDYFNSENQGNFNVVLAHRQPGSSIKPFVYATAFKKGYTPDTVVFDLKTEFNSSCNPDHTPKENTNTKKNECYSPKNYDNIFRGPITLRNAIAQSVNVPSVKTLYLAGLTDSLKTMRDMGITSLNDPDRYGLTLALGGGEVSLLEITGAYSVFANNGNKNQITGILKIEDARGKILEKQSVSPKRVLDKNTALIISDVLSDNNARAPAYGQRSWLYFEDRDVAVKTGTTNDYRDAWSIGYTPNFTLGVWVGNNDNTSMEKKVAGFIVAPLWNAFFKEALKTLPKEEFEKPKEQEKSKPIFAGEWRGGETYLIDKISKKIATEFTPQELIEEKIITQVHNILYWIDKKNPLGPKPENPEKDSQFELWEKPVRDWVETQHIQEQTIDDIPKETDDIHKPEFAPKITVSSPTQNASYNAENTMVARFSYKSKFGISQADFFLNNSYLGSSNSEPFEFSFAPSVIGEIKENSIIKIIVYDKVKNKTEITVPIKFKI